MSVVTWGPDSGLQVWGVMSWGCLTILFVGLGLFECVLHTQSGETMEPGLLLICGPGTTLPSWDGFLTLNHLSSLLPHPHITCPSARTGMACFSACVVGEGD